MDDAAANVGSKKPDSATLLKDFPGEDFLSHAGTQWKEHAVAKLAEAKLLAVARGHEPPAVKLIQDIDLFDFPELPRTDRGLSFEQERRGYCPASARALVH